jgi:hypothetical protein
MIDPAMSFPLGRKSFRDRHPDRRVQVMPADVAHSGRERLELHWIGLVGRNRIHVGAIRHHRPRLGAANDRDNSVTADTGTHLESQLLEPLGDLRRGAFLLE